MAGNVFVSNGLLSRDCGVYRGQYNIVVFPDGVVANPRELFGWNAKLAAVGNTTYAGYATTTAVLLASIFSMQSGPLPGRDRVHRHQHAREDRRHRHQLRAGALGRGFENNTDCRYRGSGHHVRRDAAGEEHDVALPRLVLDGRFSICPSSSSARSLRLPDCAPASMLPISSVRVPSGTSGCSRRTGSSVACVRSPPDLGQLQLDDVSTRAELLQRSFRRPRELVEERYPQDSSPPHTP